jgi:hypothetical protein
MGNNRISEECLELRTEEYGRVTTIPCSAPFISTVYQPWNSIFLSQQNSHRRLISHRNSLPNRVNVFDTR